MSHDHPHGAGETSTTRRALALALGITASYTVAEVVGGLLTGSLALLADAGHMLSDNVSLALALFAMWLAGKPATTRRTFGYKRAEILAALVNGMTLVAISLWIFYEAYGRFNDPPEVLAGWMLAVALLGLAVNFGAGLILYRSRGASLNVEAAFSPYSGRPPRLDRRSRCCDHHPPYRVASRRPADQRLDRRAHSC